MSKIKDSSKDTYMLHHPLQRHGDPAHQTAHPYIAPSCMNYKDEEVLWKDSQQSKCFLCKSEPNEVQKEILSRELDGE